MKSKSLLLALAFSYLAIVSSQAVTIYGLGIDNMLYSFDSATPGSFAPIGTPGSGIVDIDFRGSNGLLYGIAGSGNTFSINTSTGASTLLSTPATALNGSVSGFDVNPAADRFRVVTNSATGDNNYRLSSPGSDTNVVTVDGRFSTPISVTILDVAYTNPFSGVLGTALFSIGTDNNLYSHSVGPGFNTMNLVGGLGIMVGSDIAFDISGSGTGNIGYLASGTNFYAINLSTGAATSVGTLGVALSSFSAVPEPSSAFLGGLGALGLLRRNRKC